MIGWKELIGRECGLRLGRWGGNAPQQGKHENGEGEGADQADERGDVQALGERPAGHLHQRGPDASRELPSDRERLRQGIPGGLRRGNGNPGRHRAGQIAAVDGHPDAAERGDPQRASELGGGLRDARRGSRSLRRGGADD